MADKEGAKGRRSCDPRRDRSRSLRGIRLLTKWSLETHPPRSAPLRAIERTGLYMAHCRPWSRMGRCFAVALLGLGALSLSCSKSTNPTTRQFLAGGPATSSVTLDNSIDPGDLSALAGLEASFEKLASKAAPSVVAVSASSQVFDADDMLRAEDLNSDKLDGLLDRTTRMVGTGL